MFNVAFHSPSLFGRVENERQQVVGDECLPDHWQVVDISILFVGGQMLFGRVCSARSVNCNSAQISNVIMANTAFRIVVFALAPELRRG